MAIDEAKELRRAVDTGSVAFGFKQTARSVMQGHCLLAVGSSNAEKYSMEKVQQLCKSGGIPFHQFKLSGKELGGICGKPFVVSFACVLKAGKSKVLEAVQLGKAK